MGAVGAICAFRCNSGYVAIGRHACQSYQTKSGATVLDSQFFGGRCERLCSGAPSACLNSSEVPVRMNASDSAGPCFSTQCFSEDEALRRLARGAYALWRKGRLASNGMYSGSVNPSAPSGSAQSDQAHIGINGVALIFECVAAEMGWITKAEAAARVNESLASLAGERPGFDLARQAKDGWIPTFFSRESGAALGTDQPFTVLDSGLNSAGVLFARTYFAHTATGAVPDALAQSIARLGKKVFNLVRFEHILCDASSSRQSDTGTAIPFTFDGATPEANCGANHVPLSDGFYDFSELHYTVWLAYSRACVGGDARSAACAPLKTMWDAWQGRRTKPRLSYHGHPLLSDWPSYIVQLPFYSSHSFNADATWASLFHSHWAADWAYYNTSAYWGGDDGRYGLAAGPTDKWCSAKNSAYEADMLAGDDAAPGAQGCRLYSPFAIAGYLPAAPATVSAHLLALLFPRRDAIEEGGDGVRQPGDDRRRVDDHLIVGVREGRPRQMVLEDLLEL